MYKNEQLDRARLRKQLIAEGKTCVLCGANERLEIHRIKNGRHGGRYTRRNTALLCYWCHRREHPNSKFKIGDRVKLTDRVPTLVDLSTRRPKTIVAVRYDYTKQCNFYRLGSNARGAYANDGNPLDGYRLYEFRSYQLQPVRRYRRHKTRLSVANSRTHNNH